MHLNLVDAAVLGATLFMGGFVYGRYTFVVAMIQKGAMVFVGSKGDDD